MISVRWVSIRQAREFIRAHHRHCPSLTGGIVALGAFAGDCLVGVVVLGRPTARLDSGETAEVTRLCTNGHPNTGSKLLAKVKRLAQALGFTRLKTFTQTHESGASLRAVGASFDGTTGGGAWSRKGRVRADDDTAPKQRWLL